MISDPTAIPETEADVEEYERELQAVGGDWAKVEPLARALGQSQVATDQTRAMAWNALGNALEATDRADDAIDAYLVAASFGDPTAQLMANNLRAAEPTAPVEAGHIPQNEAQCKQYLELASAARLAGDWERADQLFSALYESPANDAEQRGQAALGIGESLIHRDALDAAMQFLQEATQIGSDGVRRRAFELINEIRTADGNLAAGTEVPTSAVVDSAETAAIMLQAAVDRYEVNDTEGARARFEAVHSAADATTEQRGYAAYYLGTMSWYAGDFDVARIHFRAARDGAESSIAELAGQMLTSHWGE